MVYFFGNYTVNGTSSWVPEPNGRGTWSLLSTCIITISLCVWSAVHLNVPEHHKAHSQYLRKFKWLLLGLFAPELVVYVAWQQRQEANKISTEINKIYRELGPLSRERDPLPPDTDSSSRPLADIQNSQPYPANSHTPDNNESSDSRSVRHPPTIPSVPESSPPWGLVQGFFALMGGFNLDVAGADQPFLPDGITRASLTADGLEFLLRHEPESLPHITAEEIKDKSKADGLKKTLVCAQALWFCIQCIARASQYLPVSLLELNTIGHALCTLAIYLLWWHKPLNVEEPVLINKQSLDRIFSYMWMSSRASAAHHSTYGMPDGLQDEFHCIWPFTDPIISDLQSHHAHTAMITPQTLPLETESNRIKRSAFLSPIDTFRSQLRSVFGLYSIGSVVRKKVVTHISRIDARRWELAYDAIHRYDLEVDLRSRHQLASSGRTFAKSLNIRVPLIDAVRNNLLNPRVELRARNAVITVAPSGVFQGLAVSGALYGGLHLAAWAAPFPSPLEGLLWKISAISVTCTGLFLLILAMILNSKSGKRTLSDISKLVARKPLTYPLRGQRLRAYVSATVVVSLGCIVVPYTSDLVKSKKQV
ncbi:MAG: hypothetical protein Q9202_007149 [Teloschistes flavicans]